MGANLHTRELSRIGAAVPFLRKTTASPGNFPDSVHCRKIEQLQIDAKTVYVYQH
jgi:hypothetical protein